MKHTLYLASITAIALATTACKDRGASTNESAAAPIENMTTSPQNDMAAK